MCGIAGCFSTRDRREDVALMTEFLKHRGPDDSDVSGLCSALHQGAGCFGHRRLAIIDLSEGGHQPKLSPGGRSCITFNGEIYNYAELKRDLESEGITFTSKSDTEVLLIGFERHGMDFLRRIRGMFAFALWDSEKRRGYLVRDRFGIKPLYVTEVGGDVLFASEVRALLATGRVPRVLSAASVHSYLATGSVTGPATIIEGIHSVPPGCVVEVKADGEAFRTLEPKRYASVCPTPETSTELSSRSHIHRIRNALRESVRYHLVSDVAVAVFLSGGIDSSAIAGLASEVSSRPLETFTVTFAEKAFSEGDPARETALRFGTNHHEVLFSGDDLLGVFPDAFAAMDQPSLDGMNTFVVSSAVRQQGLKVVLSGLGGDELFGGYPSFRRAQIASLAWKAPSALRKIGSAAADLVHDPRAARISDMLSDDSPARGAYRASRTLFGESQIAGLMEKADAKSRYALPELDGIDVTGMSPAQIVSLYEVTGYMRNTLLRDSDVFSMAHGLELRVPFIDEEVMRVAHHAARDLKLPRHGVKPLLVESVRDLLAPSNLSRRKQGFTLPFEQWMRNELESEVQTVLVNEDISHVGLRSREVRNVWSSFQQGRSGVNWSRPWALYTLIRWASENDVAWPGSAHVARGLTASPILT